MKFKTIFKKLKKHDKKPSMNRPSPTTPTSSPISSPNTASPTSYNPIQPIDFTKNNVNSTININNNVYNNKKFSSSVSSISSTSLPTSFPPQSYYIQPIKPKDTAIEPQLNNNDLNQDSISSSQVSTIPSPSRRGPYLAKMATSRKYGQETMEKIDMQRNSLSNGKIYNTSVMPNETLNSHTITLVNSNDEGITSFPSKRSSSTNEFSNTLNPSAMTLPKEEGIEEEKEEEVVVNKVGSIDRINEQLHNLEKEVNKINLQEKLQNEAMYSPTTKKMGININESRPNITTIYSKSYETPMVTPLTSPLTSPLSIQTPPASPSKKKNHSIFGYLKNKKDKKKDGELKTVYKNFSVMDATSIGHEGLIMVENQDNAVQNLWEQRNTDLLRRNSELINKSTSMYRTSSPTEKANVERNRKTSLNSPKTELPINLRPPRSIQHSLSVSSNRRSYAGPLDYSPSSQSKSPFYNNPYATSPRSRIYMMPSEKTSKTDLAHNPFTMIGKVKLGSPEEKPVVPGRNASLFNEIAESPKNRPISSTLSSSPTRPYLNIMNKKPLFVNTNLPSPTTPTRRIYHSPISPNHTQLSTSPSNRPLKINASPLPPPRTRKSPSMTFTKLSSPISPNSYLSRDDIIEEAKASQVPFVSNTISIPMSKITSIPEESTILEETEPESTQKESESLESQPEKTESSDLLKEISDAITESLKGSLIDENSQPISLTDGVISSDIETSLNSSTSQESVKSSIKVPNSEKLDKGKDKDKEEEEEEKEEELGKEEPEEPSHAISNTEISRISKNSSMSSFSSSHSSADLSEYLSSSYKESVIEDKKTIMSQEEAIKYNIENMKPIKIISDTKGFDMNKPILSPKGSGILKNKNSSAILKNKSSYSILKNKKSNIFLYGDISTLPSKPKPKLNNKLSMESKKSKVSFCENKNVYRNITIHKKSSGNLKLKRLSAGSSIAPYIVEKSLNQTTILNESSIRFDNYNTTESFSILKGNFNDESMNANIGFSESEINFSPVVSNFSPGMPSLSSFNISYDSEFMEDQEKIKTIDQQFLNNNETNSSATFYHNGKTNSLEDPLNKRQSSHTFHNDDEEISNFFENHSDNRTSFIVIDKDSSLLKEDSLFEKDTQDNTMQNSKTTNRESHYSKLRNDILASTDSIHQISKNDAFESDYTPSYPTSTTSTSNNVNSNYSIYFNNFYI